MRTLQAAALAVVYFHVWAAAALAAPQPPALSRMVLVNGHHLAFHILPGRLPALVLDAGGGADSSYWNSIIPALARRTGSEIITYDRAGFGDSDEVKSPYKMADAVTDLEQGLLQLGSTRQLVLIPHSFAGEIATYLALRHPDWMAGAVLVDTNVPDFFTDAEIRYMDPLIQPLVAAELAAHPSKTTRTLEAITLAYAQTSAAFHQAAWPAAIPCAVILSEGTPFPPSLKSDVALWTQAHLAFARRAANRELIVAKGSSHDIAHDRPEIIVEAAVKMVDRIRAGGTP